VRRNGKEEFETRIGAAREFFDYWIEREAASTDLSSLSAKMELARGLAETVSHVRDTMMQGEIVRKVTARLGVSAPEFESLLRRETREWTPRLETSRAAVAPAPRHDMAMLCLLALRDETAAAFLQQQNWRETLAQTPNAGLLEKILASAPRPEDPASLNAFMVTLTPAEESLVSAWLMQKLPPDPGTLVEGWWRGLQHAAVRRQLEAAESRMRATVLSTGEVVNLQKQILDLTEQLHDLSQFSPAPSPES
jgi:DNA primase